MNINGLMRLSNFTISHQLSECFSGYSGFLHQWNWPPRYNWNIVESGIKHHSLNFNHNQLKDQCCIAVLLFMVSVWTLIMNIAHLQN